MMRCTKTWAGNSGVYRTLKTGRVVGHVWRHILSNSIIRLLSSCASAMSKHVTFSFFARALSDRGSAKSVGIMARGGLVEPEYRTRWHDGAGITEFVGFPHKTLANEAYSGRGHPSGVHRISVFAAECLSIRGCGAYRGCWQRSDGLPKRCFRNPPGAGDSSRNCARWPSCVDHSGCESGSGLRHRWYP